MSVREQKRRATGRVSDNYHGLPMPGDLVDCYPLGPADIAEAGAIVEDGERAFVIASANGGVAV